MLHYSISNGFEKAKAGGLFSFLVNMHFRLLNARTKAFFIPHVSGMCLTSNISELCNNFFKALPLTNGNMNSILNFSDGN
jgi:hypothetical protein